MLHADNSSPRPASVAASVVEDISREEYMADRDDEAQGYVFAYQVNIFYVAVFLTGHPKLPGIR